MSEVRIGKSQVYVSKLGLGTNAVGGHNLFANLDDSIGKEIIRTALRANVTFLDTAYAYGSGRSEELIGEVLQEPEFDRNSIILATKAAQVPGDEEKIANDPAFLKQAVEDALTRLKTDYIDIFYIHFPDTDTPKNEAVAALNELKDAGKIRAIGVSNFSLDQIKEANLDGFVDVVEDQYSLLHREAEQDLFPYLKQENISFVPFFPLASGLLTEKYTKEVSFDDHDIRATNPDFQGDRFQKIIKKVNQLAPIAEKYHCEIVQLVLAWYMKNPMIASVIPGAKRPEQVTNNAKSQNILLSDEDYDAIDRLFAEI